MAEDKKTPLVRGGIGGDEGHERMGIDEMLRQHAGEFGRWQLRHFVLTSMAWALEAFHTMVMIFADREPAWRCVPGPAGASCREGGGAGGSGMCGLEAGSWEWVGGRGASTVAEWGLVCGERYKVGLVQAAFFAGCMVGAGVFGHFSDSFLGRKGALTAVCALNAVCGLLTALSPALWLYALLRLLTGFSTGGVGLCAFVLATEPVGPSRRGVAGMSTFYFFSGGIAALSGVAYLLTTSWRALYAATSLPSFLFLAAVLPFVSESPRWYLVRRKLTEAMEVMKEIAQYNGRSVPDGVLLTLDDDDSSGKGDESHVVGAVSGTLVDVVRTPVTRTRLVLTVLINFLCSVVYYGLSLNVVNLGTNLYLSVLLNAVAEMPAFLLTALLLDRLGRRPLGVATMWLSGGFCVAGALVSGVGAAKVLRMGCGVVGIFGMAATYNLLFIYTAELFPTVVRNAALGCATQAGQMGAVLAPLVVVAGERVPFLVFGVCGVVGGALGYYLPETKNKPLYDTMAGLEEGESVGKRAKAEGEV